MPQTHWDFIERGRPVIHSVDDAWFHGGISLKNTGKTTCVARLIRKKPGNLGELLGLLNNLGEMGKYSDVISLQILVSLCKDYSYGLVLSGFEYFRENWKILDSHDAQVAVLLDLCDGNKNKDANQTDLSGCDILHKIIKETYPLLPKQNIYYFTSHATDIKSYFKRKKDEIERHNKWVLRQFISIDKPPVDPENMDDYKLILREEITDFFEYFKKFIVDQRQFKKQIIKTLEETILSYEGDSDLENIQPSFLDENGSRHEYNSGHPGTYKELVDKYPSTPLSSLYEHDLESFKALYQYCMEEISNHPNKGSGTRRCKIKVILEHLRWAQVDAKTSADLEHSWIFPVQPGCIFLVNLINFLDELKKQSETSGIAEPTVELHESQAITISFDASQPDAASNLCQILMTGGGGTVTYTLRHLIGCRVEMAIKGTKISPQVEKVLMNLPYPEKIGGREGRHHHAMVQCYEEKGKLVLKWGA